jgi:hypothetical protein
MIKLLYIAAHNRSGSTLLDRILGQLDGYVSVGELRQIWARGLADNQACGCGRPFHDCEFWSEVVRGASVPLDTSGVQHIIRLARTVASARTLPQLTLPWLRTASYTRRFEEFATTLKQLYEAIHRASGGQVIVDSSKSPSYGLLLAQLGFLELHVVHLVRDSRAVAYSQQRPKLKPEIYWEEQRMKVRRPSRTAVDWVLTNTLLHLLERQPHYSRVKYEEFVDRPGDTVRRIAAECGRPAGDLPFLRNQEVWLGQAHTVSGYPIRSQQGWTQLKPDLEWQEKLAKSHRRIISAMTAPLLAKYGYL